MFAIDEARYEALLPFVRANYDAHDKTCASMSQFWFGRLGGVSGVGEQEDCHSCGHTFYLEGLAWVNWATADQDDEDIRLCACCATAAGHRVQMGQYGLAVAP